MCAREFLHACTCVCVYVCLCVCDYVIVKWYTLFQLQVKINPNCSEQCDSMIESEPLSLWRNKEMELQSQVSLGDICHWRRTSVTNLLRIAFIKSIVYRLRFWYKRKPMVWTKLEN